MLNSANCDITTLAKNNWECVEWMRSILIWNARTPVLWGTNEKGDEMLLSYLSKIHLQQQINEIASIM